MFVFDADVQPLRNAQLANLALMREMADGSATDRAILADVTALLLPTVFAEMPKDTGTAAAAQLAHVGDRGLGSIYTSPNARNPRNNAPAEAYLPFVFDRLGDENTPYAIAIRQHADDIPVIAAQRIGDALDRLL